MRRTSIPAGRGNLAGRTVRALVVPACVVLAGCSAGAATPDSSSSGPESFLEGTFVATATSAEQEAKGASPELVTQLYGHDGQIPGHMTFMGHDPKTGLTIVIGTNLATAPSGEGSALVILKELVPIFYPNAVIPGDPAAAPGTSHGTRCGRTSCTTARYRTDPPTRHRRSTGPCVRSVRRAAAPSWCRPARTGSTT